VNDNENDCMPFVSATDEYHTQHQQWVMVFDVAFVADVSFCLSATCRIMRYLQRA